MRRQLWSLTLLSALTGCLYGASAVFLAPVMAPARAQSALLVQNAQNIAPNSLQNSPLPAIAPAAPPNLGAGLPQFQPAGHEQTLPAAGIKVGTVRVIGATAFAPAMLEKLTAGLAGQAVPLPQLEKTRLALVALYRDHGYSLSTVSMDVNAQGDVRFIVTEGYIASVKLSDDIGSVGSLVLAFLNHLTAERPVSEAALEHWLLLAQQIPGVSVHAVLQSDPSQPGALTLVAEVSRQKMAALATADDRGFKNTGPTEGLAVFDLNSFTALGDQTEVSLFHTSGNTDNFGQVAESFFVGSRGLRVRLYGGAGRAQPSGTLGAVAYHSRLEVFGGQVSYPVLLRRNQALTVTLHFDGLQNLVITQGIRTSADSVRAARFAAQYAFEDLWAGNARDALNVMNVQESEGVPLLGASPDGRKLGLGGRYREKMEFWKLNASAARTQTLLNPLPETSLALRLEAGGQYSNDILPGAEEFNLGGNRFTRGFYAGQVSGDSSLYATAELQLNTGLSFTVLHLPVDFGAQFYAFYDYGETWVNLRSDLNHKLESAGGGVRLGITPHLELDGEYVRRLTTQLNPGNPTSFPVSENVIYWGITARY